MARYKVECETLRGVLGDKWLMKLEKKAFGWHYWSMETETEYGYEISSDGRSGHETKKLIKWLEFRRLSPYTKNFLFRLTEMFGKLFSFLRRLFISFGFPLLGIALLAALFLSGFGDGELQGMAFTVAAGIAIGYAICIGGTVAFSLLAVLWRKLFRIDETLKELTGEDDLEDACQTADD